MEQPLENVPLSCENGEVSDADQLNASDASIPELIFDRLEQMEFAFAEANYSLQDLTRALGEAIENGDAPNLVGADLTSAMQTLSRSVARLDSLDPRLATTQAHVEALRAKIDLLAQKAEESQLAATVKAIEETTIHTISKGEFESETARIQNSIDELASAVLALQKAQTRNEVTLSTIKETSEAQRTATDRLEAGQASLVERSNGTTSSDDIVRVIVEAVSSSMTQKLAEVKKELTETVWETRAEITVSNERLSELEQGIHALRTRPDPVLDLGPQRRSFGQYSLALSAAISKFEKLTKEIAEVYQTSRSEAQSTEVAHFTPTADIEDSLRTMENRLMESMRSELTSVVKALSQTTGTDAAAASAMVPKVTASEDAAGQFVSVRQVTSHELASMDDNETHPTATEHLFSSLEELVSSRIATEFETHIPRLFNEHKRQHKPIEYERDRISVIEEKIDLLRSRPDPTVNLAPIRQMFSQFGLVLSNTIRRFETTLDQIEEQIQTQSNSTDRLESKRMFADLRQLILRLSAHPPEQDSDQSGKVADDPAQQNPAVINDNEKSGASPHKCNQEDKNTEQNFLSHGILTTRDTEDLVALSCNTSEFLSVISDLAHSNNILVSRLTGENTATPDVKDILNENLKKIIAELLAQALKRTHSSIHNYK